MKNVIITILVIIVLGLGGYLVYDKILSSDQPLNENNNNTNNNNIKEEYNLIDKNNESVQFLYKGAKGLRPIDKVYTTSHLKVENRSQNDKYCSALEFSKGQISYFQSDLNTGYYTVDEEKLKNSYERIFGLNTYTRSNKISCACASYEFKDNKYVLVEDGCGFTSGYTEEIEEVRKYNDRIEVVALYYYHEFGMVGANDDTFDKYCTDETCKNVIVEKINDSTLSDTNIFATYKDRLNRLIYTYKLADDGFYYFRGTEVKTSGN